MTQLMEPLGARHAETGRFRGQGISVIIPAYEDVPRLRRAMWSVQQTADLPFELIVVCEKQSVAKNRNAGLERATQDLVAFLDDDVLLPACWMSRLIKVLDSSDDIGAVSALARYPNGAPQTWRQELGEDELWEITPAGACFAYSRSRVNDRRFDERYLGSQWEDTDWFWSLQQQGLRAVVTGSVVIVHEVIDAERPWLAENMRAFHDKWGKLPEPGTTASIERESLEAWECPPL